MYSNEKNFTEEPFEDNGRYKIHPLSSEGIENYLSKDSYNYNYIKTKKNPELLKQIEEEIKAEKALKEKLENQKNQKEENANQNKQEDLKEDKKCCQNNNTSNGKEGNKSKNKKVKKPNMNKNSNSHNYIDNKELYEAKKETSLSERYKDILLRDLNEIKNEMKLKEIDSKYVSNYIKEKYIHKKNKKKFCEQENLNKLPVIDYNKDLVFENDNVNKTYLHDFNNNNDGICESDRNERKSNLKEKDEFLVDLHKLSGPVMEFLEFSSIFISAIQQKGLIVLK